MGLLNFGSDGKLILPRAMQIEKDEEENAVILTKVQISEASPAVAQLKVSLGRRLVGNGGIFNSLKDQCEKYYKYKQTSSGTRIDFRENEIIVEARGSWDMYLYLKELMMNIKNNNDFRVVVRGSWARD